MSSIFWVLSVNRADEGHEMVRRESGVESYPDLTEFARACIAGLAASGFNRA
jgi:hypothetical protein